MHFKHHNIRLKVFFFKTGINFLFCHFVREPFYSQLALLTILDVTSLSYFT